MLPLDVVSVTDMKQIVGDIMLLSAKIELYNCGAENLLTIEHALPYKSMY